MSEVKEFDDLPEDVRHYWNSADNSGMEAVVYAYNAGVRAGRDGVRTQAAIAAMQGYLTSPDPQIWKAGAEPIAEWSVQNADTLIAALAKETK